MSRRSPKSLRCTAALLLALPCAVGCRQALGIEALPGLDAGPIIVLRDAGDGAVAHDARRVGDASRDGDATADAGPHFCSTVPSPPQGRFTQCNDFDEDASTFESGWDNNDQTIDPGEINGGTLVLDTSNSKSPPRSLEVSTPASLSSTADISAILLKTMPGSGPSVSGSLILEFDYYVDQLDIASNGYIIVASLDYGVGGAILYLDSDGLELEVSPQLDIVQRVVNPFPTGTWVHTEMLVYNAPSDGGPDGWVHVTSNAQDAASVLPAAFQQVAAGRFRVIVGAEAVGPVGAFKAHIDNVILNWGPP